MGFLDWNTIGSSVFCLNDEVQIGLEINQRAGGKIALSVHGQTTNEQYMETGWTSFEAQRLRVKSSSKNDLGIRKKIDGPLRFFRYLYRKNVGSQGRKGTRQLNGKYYVNGVGSDEKKMGLSVMS